MAYPKVYGFCDAGCRRQVPTYEEFEKSATYSEAEVSAAGTCVITPLKRYKIFPMADADGNKSVGVFFQTLYNGSNVASQHLTLDLPLGEDFLILNFGYPEYHVVIDRPGAPIDLQYLVCDYIYRTCFSIEEKRHEANAFNLDVDNDYASCEWEVVVSNVEKVYAYNEDAEILCRGEDGADGKSAYQIAVEKGFEGTEEEWLEYLKGDLYAFNGEIWKPWTSDNWRFKSSQTDTAYYPETHSFVANARKSGGVLATLKHRIDVSSIAALNIHIESDMPSGSQIRPVISCYDENGTLITASVVGWTYLAGYEGYYCVASSNDDKQFAFPTGTHSILLKLVTHTGSSEMVDFETHTFHISAKNADAVTKEEISKEIEDAKNYSIDQSNKHTDGKLNSVVETFEGCVFIDKATGSNWTNTTYKGVIAIVCDLSQFAGKTVRILYDSFETEIASACDSYSVLFYVGQQVGDGSEQWTYPDSDGVLKIVDGVSYAKAKFYIEYTGLVSNANRAWSCKNFRVFEVGNFKLSKNVEIPALDEMRRDSLAHNTTFITSTGLIRRAYNPYSRGGSMILAGQMHCHSKYIGEDGEWHYYSVTDERLCEIHANAGYDFITVTDYTHNGEIAQKPANTHGLTWLCNSQEANIVGDAFNVGQHMCIYNSDRLWEFNKSESPQCVGKLVRECGSVASLAHPFWSSLPQYYEKIDRIKDSVRFCEVYTGLAISSGEVILPEGKSYDYAWERLLDNGCVTWALAVNDAHHNSDATGGISNGCVKVFANANTAPDIWDALLDGNFVACSNVNADIVSVSFDNGVYTVTTSEEATVKFLKEGGVVLQETSGTEVSYSINGDEKYVRAVITDSNGHTIWTQPIVLKKSN